MWEKEKDGGPKRPVEREWTRVKELGTPLGAGVSPIRGVLHRQEKARGGVDMEKPMRAF